EWVHRLSDLRALLTVLYRAVATSGSDLLFEIKKFYVFNYVIEVFLCSLFSLSYIYIASCFLSVPVWLHCDLAKTRCSIFDCTR
uniref:Uncharacterized protein n=1 Tax=Oryza brachyantha TaxID=4533 RepID=J3LB45_ORYBR